MPQHNTGQLVTLILFLHLYVGSWALTWLITLVWLCLLSSLARPGAAFSYLPIFIRMGTENNLNITIFKLSISVSSAKKRYLPMGGVHRET